MKNFLTRLATSNIIVFSSITSILWLETAWATQPDKLGYAETIIGGELILAEERCTFHGFGTGYAIYLTNPRGTTIGKGCAMANALPSELGMIVVQWGASPIRGAESYQVDSFTWTSRGRKVMGSLIKAKDEAKARMKAKGDAEAKDRVTDDAMVAAFNKPEAQKTYLGKVENKSYPPTILITPKQCSVMVEEPDPSGESSALLVQKNNGRTALGLPSSSDMIVKKGCVVPSGDSSILVIWDYENEHPKRFTLGEISWNPKGQEWIDSEVAKGNSK